MLPCSIEINFILLVQLATLKVKLTHLGSLRRCLVHALPFSISLLDHLMFFIAVTLLPPFVGIAIGGVVGPSQISANGLRRSCLIFTSYRRSPYYQRRILEAVLKAFQTSQLHIAAHLAWWALKSEAERVILQNAWCFALAFWQTVCVATKVNLIQRSNRLQFYSHLPD